jgi:FKBP-type peptidyl-prolyl cis-trans isomerase (trigger factor)
VEALKNERRPAVIRSLKLSRILASIAKREKISITEGEVEQSAGQMAQQQGQDPTQFTTYLKENKLWDDMRRRMLEERVMNLILQNAQIEENRRPFAPPAK